MEQPKYKQYQIQVNLSEEDALLIAKKAGQHGLTVDRLIEQFIGDLIDGASTNGSDERMYANLWFDRCWFSMFPDKTFLRYLIEVNEVEIMLQLWADLQDAKSDMAYYAEHLDETETGEVEEIREFLQDTREQIDWYWNNYCQLKTEYKKGSMEEVGKVL